VKCMGYQCDRPVEFTLVLTGLPTSRYPACEICARACDDVKAIVVGSAIRLFPKEVKR